MRIAFYLIAAVAAGCAGQPSAPAPPPAMTVATPASGAPVVAFASDPQKMDEKRLAEAKKMGYKLVNQDGETLFCRTDLKTGSHVARETVCVTPAEVDHLREATQQGLLNTKIAAPPPQGH